MRQPRRLGESSLFLCAAFAVLLSAFPAYSGAEPSQVPVPAGSQPPQIDPPDDRIQTTKIEGTLKEKTASIQIYSLSKSARLFIDRSEASNFVPYLGDLEQGSHYLEVEMPGYYPLGHWFMLAEKTLYTIQFSPSRITGSIDLNVEPEDASVLVDGTAARPGLSDLPVGRHRLEVKRFGYVEVDLDVEIREKETVKLSVALEKAPFDIQGFGFSRDTFNPRSAGAIASTTLKFRAASRGSGRVEIRGPDGRAVASFDFPDIEEWNQSRKWDGLDPDGKALPDGRYTARLEAKSDDSAEPIVAEGQAWIDSSLVVRVLGVGSAVPGLLYMPDPAPAAAGTTAVEAFCFVPPKASWSSSEEAAFGLATAVSVANGIALGLHASAELETGPLSSGDLDGSILLALFGDKTRAWSGACFLRAGYSSLRLPAMPGAGSRVEASLPVAARLGAISEADARVALAPGIRADFSSQTNWLALGRAALWLEGRKFRAGLSGELPLSFEGRVSVFRGADAALEGRLLLGSFVVAAYATAEFAAEEAPAFGLGLGLGLLF